MSGWAGAGPSTALTKNRLLSVILACGLLALLGAGDSGGRTLDDGSLKPLLEGLGFTPKDLGDGLSEISVEGKELTIPMRVFLSKSKLKIWLSVTVSRKDDVDKLTRDDLVKLLERNVDIGPAHFMIERGALKIKLPVDNRDITPAVLKKEIDYLTSRVTETKSLWKK